MDENLDKARRYSKAKIRLTIIKLVMTAVFLLVLLFSGVSISLREEVSGWSGNFYLQNALYLAIFYCIYYVLFIGPDFYGGFVLEHEFALSTQSAGGWLKKSLKAAGLSLVMILITGETIYILLRSFPKSWWLLATAGWLLLTVVIGKITPTLIIPLFYKCRPIENQGLRERLLKLGETCGVRIREVFDIELSKETKKANAAVAGLGKSRRILIGDTLSRTYSEDEIEAVFAHELGHIRLRHTWKIIGMGTLISLASFYATFLVFEAGVRFFSFKDTYDIATFPLLSLILMMAGLVMLPMENWYSRYLEKQADVFGAEHINDKQSLTSSFQLSSPLSSG